MARWQIRDHPFRKAGQCHRLQPHLAGAGEDGEEQAFAAEEDVLEALDHLGLIGDGRLERGDVAGVDL